VFSRFCLSYPLVLSYYPMRDETRDDDIQSGDYDLVARVEVESRVVAAQRSGERGVGAAAKACFPRFSPGWESRVVQWTRRVMEMKRGDAMAEQP
jgi:hypothetical protein